MSSILVKKITVWSSKGEQYYLFEYNYVENTTQNFSMKLRLLLTLPNQKHNASQGQTSSAANNRHHAPGSLHSLLKVFDFLF